MKNLILFDSEEVRDHLVPLTFTRPMADIRIGILTIREKWEIWLEGKASYITQPHLNLKYPMSVAADNFVINASVLPNEQLVMRILNLNDNEAILQDGELIAARLNERQFDNLIAEADIDELVGREMTDLKFNSINHLWDIFLLNAVELKSDFALLTNGRTSAPLSNTNQIIGDPAQIFLEAGASVEAAILNTKSGPIYLAKDAQIMEGCLVRGGLSLGEGATLKMGAKIYGATTIGPHSKVGGEVTNSVIFGFSNKGHDGYLGNSILGEWCNLGADTNTSNLKNNYEEVKLWNYTTERFVKTGQQFCGLVMGDHSKCSINTMFNTGTVVGVSANVFGSGFPRNFVPSFTWGGSDALETYQTAKAFDTAERVLARRNLKLTEEDRDILKAVFEHDAKYRTWEKKNK